MGWWDGLGCLWLSCDRRDWGDRREWGLREATVRKRAHGAKQMYGAEMIYLHRDWWWLLEEVGVL